MWFWIAVLARLETFNTTAYLRFSPQRIPVPALTGFVGLLRLAHVGQRHVGALAREPIDDARADAAAAARDKRPFMLQ